MSNKLDKAIDASLTANKTIINGRFNWLKKPKVILTLIIMHTIVPNIAYAQKPQNKPAQYLAEDTKNITEHSGKAGKLSLEDPKEQIAIQIKQLDSAKKSIGEYESFVKSLPNDVKQELNNFNVHINSVQAKYTQLGEKLSKEAVQFLNLEREHNRKIAIAARSDKNQNLSSDSETTAQHNNTDAKFVVPSEAKIALLKEEIEAFRIFLNNVPQNVRNEVEEYKLNKAQLYKMDMDGYRALSQRTKDALKKGRLLEKNIKRNLTLKPKTVNKLSKT